ncbi:methylitaconate delta2-delta3-isomerase [Kocuria coralli]|uniref:Methylitaconate delta2-delta3-isomerase n=1 Tax=Kocuria coralli TaxID=1461025 RepID=A0A5J5KWQ6_9MICC|nr:PrpF domain-containing protein [Kocuria coralli]KAA9393710.1 methylitaconate delta2-delta3-isomerase [Kocuria coralli]
MDDIQARWVRGGTSKCWVFEAQDISKTGFTADTLLPRLFGSPDVRQLDGVGGGTSTTSKAVIVERSSRPGVDVDFTFAQVGIDEPVVDWGSNCGNCSTAAGLHAVELGWVELDDEITSVTTYNTNTRQTIVQRIPTPQGAMPGRMTARIPGAPFSGYEIGLGFVNPAGRTTGHLLPTGQAQQTITVGETSWRTTLIDAGAPLVLVEADALGLTGYEYGSWSRQVTDHLPALDRVRRAAAVAMGMVPAPGDAERAVPKLGLVGSPADENADINVLMLSMGAPHPAMPITGSVAMTAAALTPGTLVDDILAARRNAADGITEVADLRLRTPAGVLSTFVESTGSDTIIGVSRTARTIARAVLPIPEPEQADSVVRRPSMAVEGAS